RGVVIETGDVRPDMIMAMNTDGTEEAIQGLETKEPAFGLPALWIGKAKQEEAEAKGYTVVTASAVVATHLSETVKRYAADILTRGDVQQLLDNLRTTAESLVDDVVPDLISLPELHAILQNLLRERVCIRDLTAVLDALGYHARVSKELDYLTEQCRMALSRSICKQYEDPSSGELPVITMAPAVEDEIAQGLSDDKQLLSLSPSFTQGLLNGINQQVEAVLMQEGIQPVLLCNGVIRLPIRRLIERMLPQIAVMSYNEIGPTVRVRSLGAVQVETANAAV
ncbi:MAG: FHIPEP family type III secretion protein, partial [Cyanobacteria bacterium HKST-UBA05]|nr:FHIPEP family type III secretion protein [Cyanobacteria bacterium HKST-UBA05]